MKKLLALLASASMFASAALGAGNTYTGRFVGDGNGLTNLNANSLVSSGNTNGGNSNFFVGSSGSSTNSGSANIGIGGYSLGRNLNGNYNVADGYTTLFNNITGSGNTAIGTSALYYNTNGSYNTAIGDLAGYAITTGSSNIDIFNNGLSTDTNIIRIGSGQSDTYLVGVIHGNGSGLTGILASGISTNGGTPGQILVNTAAGTVWTNDQSIVQAGSYEFVTSTTNPITGLITYTVSGVNTNQFLGAGVSYRDAVNLTNIPAIQIVGNLNQTFPTNHIAGLVQANITWGTTNLFFMLCYTNQ